jgi:hypothetical protein
MSGPCAVCGLWLTEDNRGSIPPLQPVGQPVRGDDPQMYALGGRQVTRLGLQREFCLSVAPVDHMTIGITLREPDCDTGFALSVVGRHVTTYSLPDARPELDLDRPDVSVEGPLCDVLAVLHGRMRFARLLVCGMVAGAGVTALSLATAAMHPQYRDGVVELGDEDIAALVLG